MKENKQSYYSTGMAISVIVGIVIGIGVFFKSSLVLEKANFNPYVAIASWILAGIATLAGGFTVAEIGAMLKGGNGLGDWGQYIGLKAFKSVSASGYIGFIFNWILTFIYGPSIIMVVGYYAIDFIKLGLGVELTIGVHMAILLMIISLLALFQIFIPKMGRFIQSCATLLKTIPVLLGIVSIVVFGTSESVTVTQEVVAVAPNADVSIFVALAASFLPVLFAYDGWMYVANVTQKLKQPHKQLPLAILFGLGVIIVVYVLLNVPMLLLFTPEEIMSIGGIPGVVGVALGETVGKFMLFVIGLAAFGGCSGMFLMFANMPANMAQHHLINSAALKRANLKGEAPLAILVTTIMVFIYAFIAVIMGNATQDYGAAVGLIGDLPVGMIWMLYLVVFVGVIILRFVDKDTPRPYRTFGYPLTPILAILGAGLAVASTLINSLDYFLVMVAFTIIGVVLYTVFWRKAFEQKQPKL